MARKAIRQQVRDRLGLALTTLTAPLLVVLYWGLFADGSRPMRVCAELDTALVAQVAAGLPRGAGIELTPCPDPEAELVLRAPALGRAAQTNEPIAVEVSGDGARPGFAAAAQALDRAVGQHVLTVRGHAPATTLSIAPLGRSGGRTPFDLYVPNLLVFAMIMLVFSSAMTIAREVERGTLERLRLTQLRTREYLVGMALAQLFFGAASVVATLTVALLLGFSASGPAIALSGLVSLFTGLACIGVGTFVASVARTVAQAFAVASFFMFLLLLFSGVVFPIPQLTVLEIVPTVHGARALHEALVLDADLGALSGPLAALALLSLVFFLLGGWRFARLHRTYLHEAAS